ncbi:MAG: DUF948 domain-containing protein [Deltaproteobacteria bacterium]|nr:DUF948 domain-containing protein [Deltaproteobacteria bacterium]
MFLEISVAILSIVFLLIAVLSIPFLLQIWRTAKGITETLHMLNESLPGILKNLEEITANINKATHTVNEQIEGLSLVARRIQGLMSIVLDVENILRAAVRLPVFKTLRNALAVATGVKAFMKVFFSSRRSE